MQKICMIAIALAISIALLTVSCYAILSKAYCDAGADSSYYYAEAAILSREEHTQLNF
jgi:APA family basic amino acid/polyamine antiporter